MYDDIIRQYPVKCIYGPDDVVVNQKVVQLNLDGINQLVSSKDPVIIVTASFCGKFQWIKSGVRRFWKLNNPKQNDDGSITGYYDKHERRYFASRWKYNDDIIVLFEEVVDER